MFLFLLPYSVTQRKVSFKDCEKGILGPEEFEPLRRALEKEFVSDDSLAPLYRRLSGIFWESLEMWVLPPDLIDYLEENSWVISPLYGLIRPTACVRYAPIRWDDTFGGISLFSFWKEHIRNLSDRLFEGRLVVPFIGRRYLSLFRLDRARGIVNFEFYRKDRKVKNPLRHYAYVLRYMVEKKVDLSGLERINFYDYRVESIERKAGTIKVVMRSEGRYEL